MRSKKVEAHKASLKLSSLQKETLVGLLLGDACLETQNHGRTFRLKIEQSADHEAYVRHLRDLWGPWVLSGPRRRQKTARTGAPTVSWAFNTVSHAAFRFYAHQFYGEHGKQVPKLIHRWLKPRSLAYWFMDDGSIKSRQSKAVLLNTQGFEPRDVRWLADVLVTHYDLRASVRRQKDGQQIYLSGTSYERFVQLVDPYVIACMRHKLPPPRRTRMPKE